VGRKLTLLTSTALTTSTALLSGAVVAADLRMPVKAPAPVPVAPYSWTGCYIGGNAGAVIGWVREEISLTGFFLESSGRDTGFIGGAQVGCNWQQSPNWVLGLEGDINYAGVKRSRNFLFTSGSEDATGTQATKLQWLATLRGRIGPTWGQSFLYATGGLAVGGVKSSVFATDDNGATHSGSGSDTRVGWTVGAGFEYAFTRTISGKLEYLHFDLGSVSHPVVVVSGNSGVPTPWTANARMSGDIVRAGINIKLTP
jgi:outer membrane immunogenic protein